MSRLETAFESALRGEGGPAPLSGLLVQEPVGSVSRFIINAAITACEKLWATEGQQGRPLSSVDAVMGKFGLLVSQCSSFVVALRTELEATRSGALGEQMSPGDIASLRHTVNRVKFARGRLRYQLRFDGSGVGPTATLCRSDESQEWEEVCRLFGEVVVFLQKLAIVMREETGYLSFEEVAQILLGKTVAKGRRQSRTIRNAVRSSLRRALPDDVDQQDIVRCIRAVGYKICEGIEVIDDVMGQWAIPTWIRSRQPNDDNAAAGAELGAKQPGAVELQAPSSECYAQLVAESKNRGSLRVVFTKAGAGRPTEVAQIGVRDQPLAILVAGIAAAIRKLRQADEELPGGRVPEEMKITLEWSGDSLQDHVKGESGAKRRAMNRVRTLVRFQDDVGLVLDQDSSGIWRSAVPFRLQTSGQV